MKNKIRPKLYVVVGLLLLIVVQVNADTDVLVDIMNDENEHYRLEANDIVMKQSDYEKGRMNQTLSDDLVARSNARVVEKRSGYFEKRFMIEAKIMKEALK